MIELKDRVIFLDKIHLFNGLDQDQLAGIAVKLEEREVSAGAEIIKRGSKPDGFYMVFKGKVKVTVPDQEKGERQIGVLHGGDYFGEEALFEDRDRSATVTVVDAGILFFLSRPHFDALLTKYEILRPNFQVSIKSRKLARSKRFKWLGKNEVIYFIARRHKIRLFQALLAPVFSMIGALVLVGVGIFLSSAIPQAVGWAAALGVFFWGIWRAIDWSNDYYIVTNQRVIWLEKVLFLHDSREEAPLGTILSVGVETDQLGRILKYGNVIVRTFVGKLEFDHVEHPTQAGDMIREYWERTKAITTRSQMDVMKDTIKQKLGLPLPKRQQVELSPVVPVDEEKVQRAPLWLLALSNVFQLRIEDGGKVTYHKHWIVLIRQAWKPLGLLLLNMFLFGWRIYLLAASPDPADTVIHINAAGIPAPDGALAILLVFFLIIGGWLWYYFEDWKNDIFKVTNEEIFDIDKKPFGSEEKRSAQIENILSTSYSRDGIIANIFNYGTVKISVGGTQMAFEDVMDPAAVQADINRRRSARIAKKGEDAGKEDRERFATWLAAYHQNINEFNKPITAPADTESTNPFVAAGQDLDDLPLGGDDGIGGENEIGDQPLAGDF